MATPKPIATTRFTTDTYDEFNAFGEQTGQHWYGTPREAPQTIDLARGTIVIEMNNSKNVIEGIGLMVADGYGRRQPIYREPNWCRHTYRREAWLSPTELQEMLGAEHWAAVHLYIFKGVRNQKRFSGITGWKCHEPVLTAALVGLREELVRRMNLVRLALAAREAQEHAEKQRELSGLSDSDSDSVSDPISSVGCDHQCPAVPVA
jgi:hypothetical protein